MRNENSRDRTFQQACDRFESSAARQAQIQNIITQMRRNFPLETDCAKLFTAYFQVNNFRMKRFVALAVFVKMFVQQTLIIENLRAAMVVKALLFHLDDEHTCDLIQWRAAG